MFQLRFPLLGRESYRVAFPCQPTYSKILLTHFREAVDSPQSCGSRSIGEQIIGSLTDFRAEETHGCSCFGLERKRRDSSRQGNLVIMGLQLNHHSDEGHQK